MKNPVRQNLEDFTKYMIFWCRVYIFIFPYAKEEKKSMHATLQNVKILKQIRWPPDLLQTG